MKNCIKCKIKLYLHSFCRFTTYTQWHHAHHELHIISFYIGSVISLFYIRVALLFFILFRPRFLDDDSIAVSFNDLFLNKSAISFEDFATEFPYTIACDFKKWETQAAKDYYVSSSPTMFLLDSSNKIILRPPTVPVLDSWLQNNKEKMK